MNLIALAGPKGTGKSTGLATALQLHHGYKRLSFAEPLRAMILAGLGVDCSSMTAQQKEETIDWLGVSARKLLQTLGTEWSRDLICQDLWMRVMQRSLIAAQKADQNVVIDDVRFPNEAKLVKDFGGQLYLLRRADVATTDTHVSEAHYDNLPRDEKFDIPTVADSSDRVLMFCELAKLLVIQARR